MMMIFKLLMLLMFFTFSSQALELTPVPTMDMTSHFVKLSEMEGRLELWVEANTFQKSFFEWTPKPSQKKWYLLIAQAFPSRRKTISPISLRTPSGQLQELKPVKSFEEKIGKRTTRHDVYEGKSEFQEKGRYEILGLTRRAKFFGGWAWVMVSENPKLPKRTVMVTVGLAGLQPGPVYDVKLSSGMKQGMVSELIVMGGDGKAGNGSSNLINRVTTSGKDEWDGSQGPLWDVDRFDVKKFKIATDTGITWSIDPLLQWLYPVAGIVVVDHP